MSQDITKFKAGDKQYEVFFSPNDEHVEVYETDDPKEGLIFESHKQLISFINFLTDVIEDKVG